MKEHIKVNNDEMIKMEMKVNEFTNLCLQSYIEDNFDDLELLLKHHRKARKKITKEIQSIEDMSIVYKCQFVQTYNIMDKILNIVNRKQSIKNDMVGITSTFKDAKAVIFYLYSNTYVRQCNISHEFNIPKSTLSDLLKALVTVRCVEKIESSNRYPIYNLTIDGRRYVEENYNEFNEKSIIDQDELMYSNQQIFTQKKEIDKLSNKLPTWNKFENLEVRKIKKEFV